MQSQYFRKDMVQPAEQKKLDSSEARYSSAAKARKAAADVVRDMCTQIDFGEDDISKHSPGLSKNKLNDSSDKKGSASANKNPTNSSRLSRMLDH